MTALGDLTDVDLTGAADEDRLTYDSGAGLWKPRGFTRYQTTLSYPAGDNGWVIVDDHTAAPVLLANVDTSSLPAADAALIKTFTVTAPMIDITNADQLLNPRKVLWINVACNTALTTARTMYVALEKNGVLVGIWSGSFLSSRLRTAIGAHVHCEVGDVIKVHSWLRTTMSDTAHMTLLAAAPYVNFGTTAPDKVLVSYVAVLPSIQWVQTSPAAVAVSIVGSTTTTANILQMSQSSDDTTFLTTATSTLRSYWVLRGPPADSRLAAFVWGPQTPIEDSTAVGNPLLLRCMQFTVIDVRHAVLPIAA